MLLIMERTSDQLAKIIPIIVNHAFIRNEEERGEERSNVLGILT